MTSEVSDEQLRSLLASAFEVLASVSKATLARNGDLQPWTLVNPYALRRLRDIVNDIAPGVVDQIRDDLKGEAREP